MRKIQINIIVKIFQPDQLKNLDIFNYTALISDGGLWSFYHFYGFL
jgi:hypothetical protein